MNKQRLKTLTAILTPLTLIVPLSAYCLQSNGGSTPINNLKSAVSSAATSNQINNIEGSQKLNPEVYKEALKAYQEAAAKGEVKNKKVLTIVDFSLPSYDKRMWVVNPNTGQVLMNLYTAQGMNSGTTYATHFSNSSSSHESSLGTFITENTYYGKHGYSERLQGIDQGINNNAMSRAIVIHSASYMTPSFIKEHHRAGRSWGCFAVNPAKSQQLINLVKGGSVLFAYAPDQNTGLNQA